MHFGALLVSLLALVQTQSVLQDLTPNKFIWLVRDGTIEPDGEKFPVIDTKTLGILSIIADSNNKPVSHYLPPTYTNFSLLFRFYYPKPQSSSKKYLNETHLMIDFGSTPAKNIS